MLKNNYFILTKPGIIFGNLVTTIGGFYLVKPHPSFFILLATLLGIALVIASGCVFNNYHDRDIDKLMERTKKRPSAQGLVSNKALIFFSIILGLIGLGVLFFLVNKLSALLACIGLFFYVVLYTIYFKRFSVYGTVVGSISGAIPPVVGYCAASGRFDGGAIIIFLMLVVWQMPHSYAIAIYRLNDYMAAAIPVLPTQKSMRYTKISMLVHVSAFFVLATLPTFFSYTGVYYLGVALLLNGHWIYLTAKGLRAADDNLWAKRNFLFSIIVVTLLSLMMVLD